MRCGRARRGCRIRVTGNALRSLPSGAHLPQSAVFWWWGPSECIDGWYQHPIVDGAIQLLHDAIFVEFCGLHLLDSMSIHSAMATVAMAHFFVPMGSASTGAGKGLVTRRTNLYCRVEGKMVQVQQSKTDTMETVADPKYGGEFGIYWYFLQ